MPSEMAMLEAEPFVRKRREIHADRNCVILGTAFANSPADKFVSELRGLMSEMEIG